jgi:hypothetical protein
MSDMCRPKHGKFVALFLALFCLAAHADGISGGIGSVEGIINPAGSSLDPATTAWVSAVTTAGGTVSSGQKTKVNALIVNLKTEFTTNYFTSCDRIWIHASENTQQATIDLVNDAVATNHSATFTANQGFTGNGTSTYLDSGFNTSTSGINFTPIPCISGTTGQPAAVRPTCQTLTVRIK